MLLDENISSAVAEQVRRHRPDLVIESVHCWRDGALRSCGDRELLIAAASEDWTLVTYDLRTIPTVVTELSAAGIMHKGVVFIDHRTVAGDDFGTLTRALILLWERHHGLDWMGRVHFLDKPGH
ncbi:MAG TPA: DUF5615 family PIN-like protein [Chthonomonadales bacterium]|nr:DUF5615 family PIN-like protein [Chthonomonadales bacterium]